MTIWCILFANLMAGIIFTCVFAWVTLSSKIRFKEVLYYYTSGIGNLFTNLFGSCLGPTIWTILLENLWFIIIPSIFAMAHVYYRKHRKEGSAE